MLRWLSVALCLATSLATFIEPSQESNEPGDALSQCWGLAWVRAPDMAPGNVLAGDVKVKLIGPCTDPESYTLGLRYKERVFWKLKQQDALFLERPPIRYSDSGKHLFNETEWMEYNLSVQNKESWSVHEEERVAFEIKTDLLTAEGGDVLPRKFTTRFGILVPNTNYPPGIDYRYGGWEVTSMGDTDAIWSDFIYEYFVEIKFRNGTTSEIPAGMTGFAPFPLPTENASPVNVSLTRKVVGPYLELDVLQSNYTIEVSFPGGAHVYQDSSPNITATVHRTGYTNRTDTPIELCAFIGEDAIQWNPEEIKNRSQRSTHTIKPLAPPVQLAHTYSHCQNLTFTAVATTLAQKGQISSTSSESLTLPLYVDHGTSPDFSTYYQKLGHHIRLELSVKPDPSEPWYHDYQKQQWERYIESWKKRTVGMDETDLDWVPWSRSPLLITPQTRRQYLTGQFGISVLPMQKRRHVRSTPVHYLSDKARQPIFVDISDIHDLRLMSPEERDLIAPLAQSFIKVFAKGEEHASRYFAYFIMDKRIYVGETWAKKVLPVIADWHGTNIADHLFVVQ